MASLADPKTIIAVALGVPILAIWQEWEIRWIFLAALGFYAWNLFDNQFIHKAEILRRESTIVGPSQPFMPSEPTWEIDPNTGVPVSRYVPPAQGYQPPRGARR